MKAELRVLEAKQTELENALASAQAPAPLLIHPGMAENSWSAMASEPARVALAI
jgi:hypothetical protein